MSMSMDGQEDPFKSHPFSVLYHTHILTPFRFIYFSCIYLNNHKYIKDDILKILSDTARVTQILQEGIHAALLKHKQAGNPVCEWRDNKVVWIPPEKIKVCGSRGD